MGCGNSRHLNHDDLLIISKNLNVDHELLQQKKIDIEALRMAHQGLPVIPSCYSEVRSSSMVSLRNVLEQLKGLGLYETALRKLQLSEKALAENPSISILAIRDLLEFADHFFSEKNYQDIGAKNAHFFYHNNLKKELGPNDSVIQKMATMLEHISSFERNWNYRILNTDLNSITIQTLESEEMRSAKTYRSFTNEHTSSCRLSFVTEMSKILGAPNHELQILSGWNNKYSEFVFNLKVNESKYSPYFMTNFEKLMEAYNMG